MNPKSDQPRCIVSTVGILVALVVFAAFGGCSRNETTPSALTGPEPALSSTRQIQVATPLIIQDAGSPPAGVVSVPFGGSSVDLWPYTCASFDGTPSDPINLLFVGKADPVRIRAALLQLDGDRTAYGFPPAYPFNARWSDAIGDVQTTYAGGEGWLGSAIQLQLGNYDPVRVHLRLFRTGELFGSDGTWSVGAAHFEVMIPGTADHEVLSWELAEQLVMVDLMRSHLLDESVPVAPTDPITQTPTFRTIRDAVYNGIPEELKAVIGGPPGSVNAPVPIPNDGRATVCHIVGEAPLTPGSSEDHFTLTYDIVMPKPICSDGALEWVQISGPVELTRTTTVDASGVYEYHSRVGGRLTITPVDAAANRSALAGAPDEAEIHDLQQGAVDARQSWALGDAKRVVVQRERGAQLVLTWLRVGTHGADSYRAQSRCP